MSMEHNLGMNNLYWKRCKTILLGEKYLTDFQDCGRRIVPPFKIENECYWGCEWMSNPYYG